MGMSLKKAHDKYYELYMQPGIFDDRSIALSDASIILELAPNKEAARKRLRTEMYERGGYPQRRKVFKDVLADIAPVKRPKN